MNVAESLLFTHQTLLELKVPHALIGGMALSEYGYGRGTQDVDWLIPEEFVETVKTKFLSLNFTIFYQSEDVLQCTGTSEVDFIVARRPMSREMIENAKPSKALQLDVVQAEDLIGLKIQAYVGNPKRRNKELSDIQELIDRCPNLDWAKVKKYADLFGEWTTVNEMKESKK